MPTHYTYKCTACNRTEERYRNARKSRCCHADVVRLTAVIKTQIEFELEDCRGELQHMIGEASKLRTEFFRVCPESKNDDRFFEMMGCPASVLHYVTQWLQSVGPSGLTTVPADSATRAEYVDDVAPILPPKSERRFVLTPSG